MSAIAPLTAAREWARKHPDLEAHIYVRRWGKSSKLWTEYFAKQGEVEIWTRSGTCRNCGHVYFGRTCFQDFCHECFVAGGCAHNFEYNVAAYTVEIDLTKDAHPVSIAMRQPQQIAA